MVAGFEAIGCRGDAMVGLYVLVSRAAPDVYRGKMLTAPAESGLGGVVPASPAGGDSILQGPTLPHLRHVRRFGHERSEFIKISQPSFLD